MEVPQKYYDEDPKKDSCLLSCAYGDCKVFEILGYALPFRWYRYVTAKACLLCTSTVPTYGN
jgi:hypothetical protein